MHLPVVDRGEDAVERYSVLNCFFFIDAAMIIFLDFDGVLHPSPSGYQGIFCHLERFETVMREHPYIRIVISSSWRETYPWDVCTGIFSTDVQGRIIGMTPTIPSGVR